MPPASDTSTETVAVSAKGSRTLLFSIFALVAGGGIGAGTVGMTVSRPTEAVAMPWLSKAEVREAANEAERRANQHADAAAAAVRDECRRDLAQSNVVLNATLQRLEKHLNEVDGKVQDVHDDLLRLGPPRRPR